MAAPAEAGRGATPSQGELVTWRGRIGLGGAGVGSGPVGA